jgi:hypothetical protein
MPKLFFQDLFHQSPLLCIAHQFQFNRLSRATAAVLYSSSEALQRPIAQLKEKRCFAMFSKAFTMCYTL